MSADAADAIPADPPSSTRAHALDTLRAALTALVVLHHALLAYHPFAPAAPGFGPDLLFTAFPVVDAERWPLAGLLVLVNDTFFMALFFFVSGLVSWPSVARRGPRRFLRDRALRLGVPFLASAALLAPLAYLPAYLAAGGEPAPGPFARAWLALGAWPAGPAWFLWVLLVLDGALALAATLAPRLVPALGARLRTAREHPGRAFLAALGLGLVAYVPLSTVVSPIAWWHAGPLFVQTARIGLYAGWFGLGAAVGAGGLAEGLVSPDGALRRGWIGWQGLAIAALLVYVPTLLVAVAAWQGGQPSAALDLAASALSVVACAALSFAALSLAVRFASRAPGPLRASLGRAAFGIYLLHYAAVSWAQRALLQVGLPAEAKAALVFAAATALAWAAALALRRVPGVRRVL